MSLSRITLWILVCVGGAALLWVLAPPESKHRPAKQQTPARSQLVTRIPSLPLPDNDSAGGFDDFKKYEDSFTSRSPTVPRHATLALIAQLRDPRVAHILIDVLSSPEPAGLRRIAAGGLAPYADQPGAAPASGSIRPPTARSTGRTRPSCPRWPKRTSPARSKSIPNWSTRCWGGETCA